MVHRRGVLITGASGYLAKKAADTELLNGIRAVAKGHIFVDVEVPGAQIQNVFAGQAPEAVAAQVGPDSCQHYLSLALRCFVAASSKSVAFWSWKCLTVQLPVECERKALKEYIRRRNHILRQHG